ncbi:hypothetical protein EVAR_38635_1 [Eumeta japonica]|uniref:Uncharacterized protein n=1 Tax=Eumeta variegata TaxID=151549 RepID=A0A4C1Y1G5_EUMVA|nr:hypothetical protein EVAR_38635_1 [Eumeta japonica]
MEGAVSHRNSQRSGGRSCELTRCARAQAAARGSEHPRRKVEAECGHVPHLRLIKTDRPLQILYANYARSDIVLFLVVSVPRLYYPVKRRAHKQNYVERPNRHVGWETGHLRTSKANGDDNDNSLTSHSFRKLIYFCLK